jgi:hypothetical protein
VTLRGKWAVGIPPRNFCWVIKDKLAASERPGGHARNHRKIRRQEEILWIKNNGFTKVVSLLPSTHNLHAYAELGMAYAHVPLPPGVTPQQLADLYGRLQEWLRSGERILLHQEEFGDVVMGVLAGYLLYAGLLKSGPQAIAVVEELTQRPMGAAGRELVAMTLELVAARG